jgi:hypothetical protein
MEQHMSENLAGKYPVLLVNPEELYSAEYQPQSRMQMNGALTALAKSIRQDGLQYPPLVVRKADGNGYSIIDGHRRVKVAKELQWPSIPVIVSSQGDAKRLFAAVSGAQKPLTAVDWIEVYVGGGELPPGPTAVNIRRIDQELGREFLYELIQKQISPAIWTFASKVLKYTGLDASEKPAVIRWLAKHKLTQSVMSAMKMEMAPTKLVRAFKEGHEAL